MGKTASMEKEERVKKTINKNFLLCVAIRNYDIEEKELGRTYQRTTKDYKRSCGNASREVRMRKRVVHWA